MVHRPTRGSGPRRHGGDVPQLPEVGPSDLVASVYTDPLRYERERELAFRHSWLIAGRAADISEPGDHLHYEGHGETVLVVRQRDGSVSAFHNVCQHRGAPLVSEGGCAADGFVCPWHGWAYGLDGKLRGIPDREDFSSEQLDGLRAPRVAVEEFGGWLWIFLAGTEATPPLTDWLGEIGPELDAYRMEDMFVADKLVWDLPVNYKAVVDGFNEMYHIAQTHKVPPVMVKAARETSFAVLGPHSMMVVPLGSEELRMLEETGDHPGSVTCHYVVFPNAVFNNLPDHLQLFLPIPLGPERTRFECYELQYRDGDRAYRERVDQLWQILKVIVEQDITLFKSLSRTSASMARERNRLSDHECKITAYHETMAAIVGDDLAPTRMAKR